MYGPQLVGPPDKLPAPPRSLVSAPVARTEKPDPDRPPGYRSTAVVSVAGAVGVALVAALVLTVVRMSDQWSSPPTPTVLSTSNAPTTQQTLRTTEPFIATPSYESSTFPTSVDLSTTDIGVPGEATSTTESSTTSSGESTTSRTSRPPRTQDDDDDGEQTTTTTRKRPRLNETRTLSP